MMYFRNLFNKWRPAKNTDVAEKLLMRLSIVFV